jgi:hypothetical protein
MAIRGYRGKRGTNEAAFQARFYRKSVKWREKLVGVAGFVVWTICH